MSARVLMIPQERRAGHAAQARGAVDQDEERRARGEEDRRRIVVEHERRGRGLRPGHGEARLETVELEDAELGQKLADGDEPLVGLPGRGKEGARQLQVLERDEVRFLVDVGVSLDPERAEVRLGRDGRLDGHGQSQGELRLTPRLDLGLVEDELEPAVLEDAGPHARRVLVLGRVEGGVRARARRRRRRRRSRVRARGRQADEGRDEERESRGRDFHELTRLPGELPTLASAEPWAARRRVAAAAARADCRARREFASLPASGGGAMPHVQFTRHLSRFFPRLEPVTVDGATVSEVVRALEGRFPGLTDYIVDERGRLRQHVNVYIGDSLVQDRERLSDPLEPGAKLFVMQALSGG